MKQKTKLGNLNYSSRILLVITICILLISLAILSVFYLSEKSRNRMFLNQLTNLQNQMVKLQYKVIELEDKNMINKTRNSVNPQPY